MDTWSVGRIAESEVLLTCPAWISDCDSAIRVAIPFSLCVINGATENEEKVQKTCKAGWLGDDLCGVVMEERARAMIERVDYFNCNQCKC